MGYNCNNKPIIGGAAVRLVKLAGTGLGAAIGALVERDLAGRAETMVPGQDPRAVRSGAAMRLALLALLESKPFEHITIREIAAQAGIGYATFFRHHPSKEALLNHIAADEIERLMALALPALDVATRQAACQALCRYVDAHRALWTSLLTGGAAGTMREACIAVSRRVAADRADAPPWLPVELAVIHASSAMVEILAWWLRQAEPLSVERIADILDRLVITPVVGA